MTITPLVGGQFQVSTEAATTYDINQLVAQSADLTKRLEEVNALIAEATAAGVLPTTEQSEVAPEAPVEAPVDSSEVAQ
jgi:hypothetical protein